MCAACCVLHIHCAPAHRTPHTAFLWTLGIWGSEDSGRIFASTRIASLPETLCIVRISKCYKTTFRELDLFPSSGYWKETHTLLGRLKRADLNDGTSGTNTVCVSASPEDRNTPRFRNVPFSACLELPSVGKIQKSSSIVTIVRTLYILKIAVFSDVAPCNPCKNRRFGRI
jgi:hypothetical protein